MSTQPNWRDGFARTREIMDAAERYFARALPEMDRWHFAGIVDPTLFQLFPVGGGPQDASPLTAALGGTWKDDGADSVGRCLRSDFVVEGHSLRVIVHYCAVADPKRELLELAEDFIEGFVDGATDAGPIAFQANYLYVKIREELDKDEVTP